MIENKRTKITKVEFLKELEKAKVDYRSTENAYNLNQ